MIKQVFTKHKTWRPIKPASKGATAYHDAVINASWHIDNIKELIKTVQNNIKDGDVVVDFGAGTGSSAFYLLQQINKKFKLWLVDNSASWLGKAHDLLSTNPHIEYFLLEKTEKRYAALEEAVGKETVHHVLSANTVHLIPNLEETFRGIYGALKLHGSFIFQSGNINCDGRKEGVLMIDDTVKHVYDLALKLICSNSKFARYRKELEKRIEQELPQRKLVFPDPRPIEYYLKMLKSAGFKNEQVHRKHIRVKYKDWLAFLRVKRLQAGILPEIGGRNASLKEERDRDELITLAAGQFFKHLKLYNRLANNRFFTSEWIYVTAEK